MKSKLLNDHKKIGKIYQPPIIALGNFIETAWLDFSIPEFIWIHILCEECGVEEGSNLFLEFTTITDGFLKTNLNGPACTLISSYNLISNNDKNEIILKLEKKSVLPRLRFALNSFLNLYPECPLNFIKKVNNASDDSKEKYLSKYKDDLRKIEDKTSFESTIVMSNIINFLNHSNRLRITTGSDLPQLSNVLDYPNTEKSKRLASFLRSTISMCFNKDWGYNRDNEWIKYFWNQSLKLEPCTL